MSLSKDDLASIATLVDSVNHDLRINDGVTPTIEVILRDEYMETLAVIVKEAGEEAYIDFDC